MIKFFEILSFDMSHMISTDYIPTAAVWLSSERGLFNRVGVADQNSGAIRVYRADGGQQGILAEIGVHTQPVKCVAAHFLSASFPTRYQHLSFSSIFTSLSLSPSHTLSLTLNLSSLSPSLSHSFSTSILCLHSCCIVEVSSLPSSHHATLPLPLSRVCSINRRL